MKQAEIIELSIEALRERIVDVQVTYRRLKMTHAVSRVENPLKLRSTRRVIARLKTELKKRELEPKKA